MTALIGARSGTGPSPTTTWWVFVYFAVDVFIGVMFQQSETRENDHVHLIVQSRLSGDAKRRLRPCHSAPLGLRARVTNRAPNDAESQSQIPKQDPALQ